MTLFFYEEEYATEISAGTCKGLIIAENYTEAMRKLKSFEKDKYTTSVKLIPLIEDITAKGEYMQLSMSFDDSVSNDNYKALLNYLKKHID